ncbi:junctional cadherin 5-associated protein [Lampris incognitus]|uniref:junctional cadherin 5-associated protein n=1 Tax=Lampris incognitus TaxID=2546036 RepID=UPI0024B54A08|nr:junctional cadherin 5-associated protein [Lampris incognitus]
MYSVEDLLISHGYKLPQHTPSSTPIPTPAPSTRKAPSPSPPSYNNRHEMLENRSGHRTVNGYESEVGGPYGTSSGTRQTQACRVGCSNNNNQPRDRSQSRREGDSRSQGDTHSVGESLTSDSGFCDGPKGPHSQSKDVSYWRRRGQDFTVLLDYADLRESHGGGQGGYARPETPQQPRGQNLSTEEHQRAIQERQRWAAQAHARSRERETALHQWRMAAERKCQSLGTDEWRPAVSFGRQLSENEGERWAQEQQRLHARTPEGMVVHPRTKAKSQSLPRMLQPDSLQYVDMTSAGQELYRRVNGHLPSSHNLFRGPRWPDNGRPASANQLSMTPKPRFTRPPRPPSYEVHQQIRGSCEVLSGRDSAVPQARDRTPLPLSRTGDPQLDYFAQDSGPPGYIPPPSYKRAPIMRGGRRGYGEIPIEYRYRGDVYQQMQMAPDGSHWFARHPAGSWPDSQRERSAPNQKQLYPVYTTQEHPGGGVQYIPFDDPRVRHISSALGGNSLTDADKIRHIRNELPSVTVSEPASDDSAFLPPPLGPFVAAKLTDNRPSSSDFDNDNNRWHSDLHKETVDNFPATDQNCNNRYSKNQRPPPSPSSVFQAPVTASASSRQGSSIDHGFAETITQVKKIVPDSGPENNRNSKRRVSETIFCLVSVPIHTPTNISKDSAADQNNNNTIPSLTVTNADSITVGHKENHNLHSKSVTEMPIRPHYFHTSSTSSVRNYKRAPLRKEIIDAWALQASEDKELCYAGSWPGNQYRNQETQTSSPLTVEKSPTPQSPPSGQEPGQSASDTTTDSGMGTDSSTSYSYPMEGQKNLHPSSNSAFSRPSLSPSQPTPLQPSQQSFYSPSSPSSPSKGEKEQGDQQPPSPRKNGSCPPDGGEQVAFGQFLLKPVNRRPWDAIGELECFNKELQDTISKRPNVDHCSEDMDDVQKKILELNKSGDQSQNAAHLTTVDDLGRETASFSPVPKDRPNKMKRSQTCGSTTDRSEVRSAFSRPQAKANTRLTRDELSTFAEHSLRDYSFLSSLSPQPDPIQVYRQDIPVPQESLLRDVGLTVYTETPGAPGEPIQRSLSMPSPLNNQELCHSVQLSWESRTVLVRNNSSPEHNSNKELQAEVEVERIAKMDKMRQLEGEVNLNIRRVKSENSRLTRSEELTHITRLTGEAAFAFEGNDNDERYTIPEPLSYRNESTIADKHLENLLIQEKANALPAEDLSNLYEVKSAKGIPENESIEQRAARILGIAVPVEALGVADKMADDLASINITTTGVDITAPSVDTEKHSSDKETQKVAEQCEQVEESLISQGKEIEEDAEPESAMDHIDGKDREEPSNDYSDAEVNHNSGSQLVTVLDLPEFPPSTLPLSLPVTPDKKLMLSMCCGEKKGCGVAPKPTESQQDELSSSASSAVVSTSRSATEELTHQKKSDSEKSPFLGFLCHKSSDSEGEVMPEERDEDAEESEALAVTEGEVIKKQEDEEEEKYLEEEIIDKAEEVHEDKTELREQSEEAYKEEEQGEELAEVELKITEEEMEEDIALNVTHEGEKEEIEGQPQIEEDNKKSPLGKEPGDENTLEVNRAEASKVAEREELPRPKQRTRPHKPPLLPKPRSVPKREITLPLSFSSETFGSTCLEDEETLSVSDPYDPSRVERV